MKEIEHYKVEAQIAKDEILRHQEDMLITVSQLQINNKNLESQNKDLLVRNSALENSTVIQLKTILKQLSTLKQMKQELASSQNNNLFKQDKFLDENILESQQVIEQFCESDMIQSNFKSEFLIDSSIENMVIQQNDYFNNQMNQKIQNERSKQTIQQPEKINTEITNSNEKQQQGSYLSISPQKNIDWSKSHTSNNHLSYSPQTNQIQPDRLINGLDYIGEDIHLKPKQLDIIIEDDENEQTFDQQYSNELIKLNKVKMTESEQSQESQENSKNEYILFQNTSQQDPCFTRSKQIPLNENIMIEKSINIQEQHKNDSKSKLNQLTQKLDNFFKQINI